MASEVLLITGMVIVTFSIRYVLFFSAEKIRFPPWLRLALDFVPAAVLTAIIVPAVLMPQGEIWASWKNPWLLAAIFTAVVALIKKDLLITVIAGMSAFLILRLLLPA